MKNTLLLLAAVGVTATASAQISSGSGQISITAGAGLTYMQNFNTLDTSSAVANVSTNLPAGWYITENGAGAAADGKYRGRRRFQQWRKRLQLRYISNYRPCARFYCIFLCNQCLLFGAKFVNNTGATITAAAVTLKMEQWRVGDTFSNKDTTLFAVSMTADSLNDTTAAAAWMDVPSMMLTSAVAVGAFALDGNLSANQTAMTGSLTGLSIPNGATLWVRWKDKNLTGSDDGLSIDDMSITFTTGPSAVSNIASNNLPFSLLGNGTTNDVKAIFTAPENGAYTVTVSDLAGRVVSLQNGTTAKGENIMLPVSNTTLASGLYLVRVAQGTFAGTQKLSVR